VSISTDDGRSTPDFACRFFASTFAQFPTKRSLRCSATPLALLACLSAGAARAQVKPSGSFGRFSPASRRRASTGVAPHAKSALSSASASTG